MGHCFMIFTIIAKRILLSADKGLMHAQEAVVVSESTIMRSPKFIIRVGTSSDVNSNALWLMELREIKVYKEGFCVGSIIQEITLFSKLVSIRSIHHELLRNAVWFNDDVLNDERSIGDGQFLPSLTLVPRELNERGWFILLGNHDDGTMVTDVINVDSVSDVLPVETTVTRQVQSLWLSVLSQTLAQVTSAKDNTDCLLSGVDRGELSLMRVDLQMERAAVLKVALGWLSCLRLLRGLDEFPLATLVVGDKGSHILLYLFGWHRLFKLENFLLGLCLLFVDISVCGHA